MALPHSKTWSFSKKLRAYTENPSPDYMHYRKFAYDLKEVFVGLGWTVEGSYAGSGTVNNNNQVDTWTSPEAMDRVSADLWVHLKGPAGSGFEIVIAAMFSNSNTWTKSLSTHVSQSAGFGSINGGTDGTTSAFPSATDQANPVAVIAGDSATRIADVTYSMYGAISSDGKNCRILVQQGRVVNWFMCFEHLDNPNTNLDGGKAFTVRATGSTGDADLTELSNSFYTNALFYGRVSGVNRTFYLGTQGYANVGMQSLLTVQDDNKMTVHTCDLYNNTVGERAYMGTVPDLYWGNNQHFSIGLGDTVGGPMKWFSGGSIITPWDSSEPLPKGK